MRIGINLLTYGLAINDSVKPKILQLIDTLLAHNVNDIFIIYANQSMIDDLPVFNTYCQIVHMAISEQFLNDRIDAGEIDVLMDFLVNHRDDILHCATVSFLFDDMHLGDLKNSIGDKGLSNIYTLGNLIRSSEYVFVSTGYVAELLVSRTAVSKSRLKILPLLGGEESTHLDIFAIQSILHESVETYENTYKWYWSDNYDLKAKQMPLVSIITPSYQQGKFIKETIESVLSQDYPNLELLVIDGGSTDSTIDILKSYGSRIKWVSEKDEGQTDAINKGIERSMGNILGWVNSDDILLPGAISKAVFALKKRSGALLVYGEGMFTDFHGVVVKRYRTELFSVNNLLERCIVCQPTVFFDRRLIDMGGTLNKTFHMAMDYELWLRYSRITRFLYIPEYLAMIRIHSESKTSNFQMNSLKESVTACRINYGRTSFYWCRRYGVDIAARIPVIKYFFPARLVVIIIIFGMLVMRDMVPFQVKKIIRYSTTGEAIYRFSGLKHLKKTNSR